jgi:hypothetical protein
LIVFSDFAIIKVVKNNLINSVNYYYLSSSLML